MSFLDALIGRVRDVVDAVLGRRGKSFYRAGAPGTTTPLIVQEPKNKELEAIERAKATVKERFIRDNLKRLKVPRKKGRNIRFMGLAVPVILFRDSSPLRELAESDFGIRINLILINFSGKSKREILSDIYEAITSEVYVPHYYGDKYIVRTVLLNIRSYKKARDGKDEARVFHLLQNKGRKINGDRLMLSNMAEVDEDEALSQYEDAVTEIRKAYQFQRLDWD